jgi:hypothetical protein
MTIIGIVRRGLKAKECQEEEHRACHQTIQMMKNKDTYHIETALMKARGRAILILPPPLSQLQLQLQLQPLFLIQHQVQRIIITTIIIVLEIVIILC